MNILVTGGAGYIGSHTIIELDKAGHSVVVVDNLVNSCDESLRRVSEIIGKEVPFVKADVRDYDALSALFKHSGTDNRLATRVCHGCIDVLRLNTAHDE